MKRSSINEKHRNNYHAFFRLRTICVAVIIIGIIGVVAVNFNNDVWLVAFYMIILLGLAILRSLYRLGRHNRFRESIYICVKSSNIISINQYHEINKNYIKVYDTVDGEDIENTFSWEDIKQIELIDFHEDLYMYIGEETLGLMFVADKDKLYRGIDKTDKYTDEISKRRMKLEGGFFIECKPSELADIQAYSGRKIIGS